MTRELLKDKLTEKLIEGISSGRYPVGSLLPKELQLVESEGVSRHQCGLHSQRSNALDSSKGRRMWERVW